MKQMDDTPLGPDYGVFSHSSGKPLDTVEAHVLARAYRAAWRSLFAGDPLGPHVIAPLDVLFVFAAEGAANDS
jgi:hypothetical protein